MTVAHACQYPKENDYNEYLSANSGYSNAYTAATETNYYFEVAASTELDSGKLTNGASTSPLYGALDRFAQFFISPLFLSSTLDRELKAVDSENKKICKATTGGYHSSASLSQAKSIPTTISLQAI